MFWSVVVFELRYALRGVTFWCISAAFFLFALIYSSSSVAGSALTTAAINVNSPWAITRMVVLLSYLGVLAVAAFAGASIIRDDKTGMAGILFCTRMRKPDYVFGRFVGGFLTVLVSFSFVFLGLVLGNLVPWADPRLLGPFPMRGLLAAYAMFAVPNMFIASCVLFSIALLTRDTMKTYVGAVAILIAFFVSQAFAGAFYATRDAMVIASLAEPFGAYAAMMAVLDWTPYERNHTPILAQAYLGHNRLLWVVGTAALLLGAYLRFPFQTGSRAKAARKPRRDQRRSEHPPAPAAQHAAVTTTPQTMKAVEQVLRLARFEVTRILRSAPFLIIMALSCVGLWLWVSMYGRAYGTGFYPYTGPMAAHIQDVFEVPLIALLIFYAADLTWASRLKRVDQIIESSPVTNAALFLSKLLALFAIAAVALALGTATAVAFQLYRGFWDIEPAVYAARVLLVALPYFLVMATLALTLQAFALNRFLGMLAMAAVYVFSLVAVDLGVESNLLIPGGRHEVHHNALAGFGHFLVPVLWFHAYWLIAAVLLALLGTLAWRRGKEAGYRARLQAMRAGLSRSPLRLTMLAALLGLAAVGSVIAYQTTIRNPTATEAQREALAVEYETRYADLRDLPQPNIVAIEGHLRLFPRTRHFAFEASCRLVNREGVPLQKVVLTAAPDTTLARVATARGAAVRLDPRHGTAVLDLDTPLEPGEQLTLDFTVGSRPIHGFRNRAQVTPVAYDGSLLFYNEFVPVLGYARSRELSDELAREDHGLPTRASSVRAADDPRGLREHEGQPYADWLTLDLTISTDADQIAIGQGKLVEQQVTEQRASFRYVTQAPVKLHMGIVSGSYRTAEQVHPGRDGPVRIAIHYMPGHGRNIDALMRSLRHSLTVLENHFGPYPYDQLKLVEVAMDKPTFRLRSDTILSDSSLGFINDPRLDDPRSPPSVLVKLPASMVANLYVQSIVMAANQPGATSIPDGLGFYLAGLVWSEGLDPAAIAEAIRDTQWHYFIRRATEEDGEGTIVDHVNQTYVGAHKNAVAMYALELYLGREKMIEAIRRFLHAYRFQSPPFARMSDLVDRFRAVASDDTQPIITDLFERRTLFDVAVTDADVERTAEDTFQIHVKARARKLYVTPDGRSRAAAFDYPVPLVAFGERIDRSGARRILGRVMITPDELADGRVSITVRQRPRLIGLDPFYRLLDRNLLNNRLPPD